MKIMFVLVLSATVFCSAVIAQEKDTCAAFRKEINSVYNFKPSKLTDAQRDSKSADMDRVWEMVKNDQDRLLPCLRIAIQEPDADQWFQFDGSNLLVALDPSDGSKGIQIKSHIGVDLDDIDPRDWVTVIAKRGYEGFDVSEAGSRWLAYPEAGYYLPEHGAFEINAPLGGLIIFGGMDESRALPGLTKIISQKDHPGREYALWILTQQATPESLRILGTMDTSSFSESAKKGVQSVLKSPKLFEPRVNPMNTREEFINAFQAMIDGKSRLFVSLISKVPDGEKDVVAVLRPEDIPLVRRVRRLMLLGGDQHSIDFYDSFTQILMTLVWKPEVGGQGERHLR